MAHPFDINPWSAFQTIGGEEPPDKPWQVVVNWAILVLGVSIFGMLLVPIVILYHFGRRRRAEPDPFDETTPGQWAAHQLAILGQVALIPIFWAIGWKVGSLLIGWIGYWPGFFVGLAVMNVGVNLALVWIDRDLRRQEAIDDAKYAERERKLREARDEMFGKIGR
jgi:hypothetical protein